MGALSRRLTEVILKIEGYGAFLMYAPDDGKSHSQREIADVWKRPRATLNSIVKRREMEIRFTSAGVKKPGQPRRAPTPRRMPRWQRRLRNIQRASLKRRNTMGKTSSTVKNRYNAKAYDQLPIRIPKGQKQTIQAAADEAGESVNKFANKALLARIGIDKWPVDKNNEHNILVVTSPKIRSAPGELFKDRN